MGEEGGWNVDMSTNEHIFPMSVVNIVGQVLAIPNVTMAPAASHYSTIGAIWNCVNSDSGNGCFHIITGCCENLPVTTPSNLRCATTVTLFRI